MRKNDRNNLSESKRTRHDGEEGGLHVEAHE